MELQIYHEDPFKRSFICGKKSAVIALLFKVSDTANDFFDWIPESLDNKSPITNEINISKLIPKDVAMHSTLRGYVGSDTQPNCQATCWYVIEEPFPISQAQLDFFKYADVPLPNGNSRTANFRLIPNSNQMFKAAGLFATPDL